MSAERVTVQSLGGILLEMGSDAKPGVVLYVTPDGFLTAIPPSADAVVVMEVDAKSLALERGDRVTLLPAQDDARPKVFFHSRGITKAQSKSEWSTSYWRRMKELQDELAAARQQSLENYRAARTLAELRAMADERHGTGAEVLIRGVLDIAEKRALASEVWIG